jgi:hypothetical protein
MMAVIKRYDDIHKRFNKISSILTEVESQVTNNILQAASAAENHHLLLHEKNSFG